MKKYDFDKPTDRSGTDSLKWRVKDGELPMWVADMDFEVCPDIIAAIEARLKKPALGYTVLSDGWYDSYIRWWNSRHGCEIKREWMCFASGIVPAVASLVRTLTPESGKVLLQTPVYNAFFDCIRDNGRRVEENVLVYRGGEYSIDFDDLEARLADPDVSLMILCNPHNPIGKIWDRATLERIGRLCKKHSVVVISDEIHCDIVAPGASYTPFLTLDEDIASNSITCISPSKAFNIAGLATSAVVVPDGELRARVVGGLKRDHLTMPNVFAGVAAAAALDKGGDWLDGMREYVEGNRALAGEYIAREIPALKLVKADATYLAWIDCSEVCLDSVAFTAFMREHTGLFVSDGAEYGECGRPFVRLNLGCRRALVQDGLERLKRAAELYKAK